VRIRRMEAASKPIFPHSIACGKTGEGMNNAERDRSIAVATKIHPQ
jgi:hypothetical protein